jgi:cyanophycinase-like exopeptidase
VKASSLPRILTVMGSGETTPTMAKVHRATFERLGGKNVPAVLLDTPYGFQENADDISARAVTYFHDTVGHEMGVASYRSAEADPLARETATVRVRDAALVFTGPGSPSYALRQWAGSEIPKLLAAKLAEGGAVTMASAAALTLGRFTIPVYEIYKVGETPRWLEGLDLLGPLGLPVAVVPHYDNAEGGNHDTRFCYLGERRLEILEAELPPEVFILGVDGHTALVFDLDARTASVEGLGVVTVRKDGRSATFAAGSTLSIDELLAAATGAAPSRAAERAAKPVAPNAGTAPAGQACPRPLREEAAELERVFNASLEECDAQAAVRAILTLEETIQAWAGDTDQSDALATARSALRGAIVCLGEMAGQDVTDPHDLIAPFVDALLAERLRAREARDWAAADAIRDRLLEAGIELHDTPEGTTWELHAAEAAG